MFILSLISLIKSSLPLLVLCLVQIFIFPIFAYSPSSHTLDAYDMLVDYTLKNHLVDNSTPFSLISVNALPNKVPIGHEYRFLYLKQGLLPLDEHHYSSANKLLIFSAIGQLDVKSLKSWELDQFGSPRKTVTHVVGNQVIYELLK